jgi:WD40 repeat protein
VIQDKGKPSKVLEDEDELILCLSLSPDGSILASGGREGSVYLWDTRTGQRRLAFKHKDGQAVTGLAFSPDGKNLLSTAGIGTITGEFIVWDLTLSRERYRQVGLHGGIYSAAISPDGQFFAVAGFDQIITCWDLAKGKQLLSLKGHEYSVTSLVFSQDSKTLYSGSRDKTVRLWEIPTGKPLTVFHGHKYNIRCLIIGSDGKTPITGAGPDFAVGKPGEIRIWDPLAKKIKHTVYLDNARGVDSAALIKERKLVVAGCSDGTIRFLSEETGKEVGSVLILRNERIEAIVVNGTGTVLAFALHGENGTSEIQIWDAATLLSKVVK